LLFLALAMAIATGLAQDRWPIVYGFYLPSMHRWWAVAIGIFTVAHLIAVFLHDLKGTACDVSAMINGHRIFVIPRIDPDRIVDTQRLSLDNVVRLPPRDGSDARSGPPE
jgi:Ni/Fe-hydrogenase 1 B-type cytochrome subunit